jgi:hypothetical protein
MSPTTERADELMAEGKTRAVCVSPSGLLALLTNTPEGMWIRMVESGVPDGCAVAGVWPMFGDEPALVAEPPESLPTGYAIVLVAESFDPMDAGMEFFLAGPQITAARTAPAEPEKSPLILPPGFGSRKAFRA